MKNTSLAFLADIKIAYTDMTPIFLYASFWSLVLCAIFNQQHIGLR